MQGDYTLKNKLSLAGHNFILSLESVFLNFYGSWSLNSLSEEAPRSIIDNLDYLVKVKGRTYIIHPADVDGLKEIFHSTKSKQDVNLRFRVGLPDNQLFEMEAVGYAVGEKKGLYQFNPERTNQLLTEEIAKRKQLEYEQRLVFQIPNNMNQACYQLDHKGNVLYANQRALDLFNMTSAEMVGRNIWDIKSKTSGCYEAIQIHALDKKEFWQQEYISTVSNKWISLSATPTEDGCIVLFHEIEELVAERQKLFDEHRRLKEAQAIGHVGSFEWDAKLDRISWSDELYRIHGLQPQSVPITLATIFDFIHPDDSEWVIARILNSRKNLIKENITHRIIRNGEVRYVNRQFESFVNHMGEVTHVAGTIHDVTDLKTSEEALKKENQLLREVKKNLRAAINSLELRNKISRIAEEMGNMGTWTWNPQTNEAIYSDNMFVLFGIERQEPTFEKILQFIHPDDRPRLISEAAKLKEGENPEPIEYRIIRRDGVERIFRNQVYRVKNSSGLDTIVGTTEDITDERSMQQKNKEQDHFTAQTVSRKYYSLFNTIDQGFCIIEMIYDESGEALDYRFTEANPAFEGQTGLKDVVGKLGSTLTPDAKPYWIHEYEFVIKTGKQLRLENYDAVTQRWYSAYVWRLSENGNEVAIIFTDVTERKLAERRHEFLLKLSDTIRFLSNSAEIESIGCRMLGEHLGVNRTYYATINEQAGYAKIEGQYLRSNAALMASTYPLSAFSWSLPMLRNGDIIIIDDIHNTDLIPPGDMIAMESLQQRSLVSVPFIKNGELIGALTVSDDKSRVWRAEKIELVQETLERILAATQQARAEKALRRSEEKYRAIFNSINEGFSLLDIQFDYTGKAYDIIIRDANPAQDRIDGVRAMIGKRVREILPNIEMKWIERYASVVKTGEPASFEEWSEANQRWYSVHASRIGEEGSTLVAIVYDDITQRKKAEERLAQSERRQSYLLKLSDAIKPLADPDEIKKAAAQILGDHIHADRIFYSETIFQEGAEFFYIDFIYQKPHVKQLSSGAYLKKSFGKIAEFGLRGENLIVNNINLDTRIAPEEIILYESFDVKAFVGVPLLKNGKIVAVTGLHSVQPRLWTEEEIVLLEETTERIWSAVARAQAEKELRQAEDRYRNQLEKDVATRTIELQENKSLLQSVFDSSVNSINVFKAVRNEANEIVDFEWILTNSKAHEYMPHKQLIGKRYTEVYTGARRTKIFDQFVNVVKTGTSADFEVYYNSEGIDGWFRNVVVKLEDGLVVTSEEVTDRIVGEMELKEAMDGLQKNLQLLKQAEDVAEMGSWEYLTNIKQFTWSEGMYRIFALPSEQPPYPELYLEKVIEEDKEIAQRIVKSIKHEPKSFDEIIRVKTNGKIKTIKVRATIINDSKNQPAKVLGVDLDITAITEGERLKELNSKLRELDQAKTKFFSNVSHEFRTPITLLLGPLDDILKNSSALPLQQVNKLQLVRRNSLRLQKLVNSLLDFTRFEAGKTDAIFQPTDIAKYTTDLAGNFKSILEDEGLKLIIKCDELKEPIYLNRNMYEKIILNLLSNAFKFTFAGKIEVKVRNKKKKVEVQVIDTGVGIESQYLSRIFERFNRIEGKKSRTFEGTGIGLALVKEMVKMHHGDITVKSEIGKGSTFTVTIPKGNAHLEREKIFEAKDAITGSTVPSYLEEIKGWLYEKDDLEVVQSSDYVKLKPTVLLADDNADMRNYLSIVLQPHFHLIKVENGKKAWEIIKSGFLPDLVLADVMMPELDGFELLEKIRHHEASQKIQVILLSARTDEDSRIEGLKSGADDYLVKPFAARELIARVDARIQIANLREKIANQLAEANTELEKTVQKRTEELRATNESLKRKNLELTSLNQELTDLTFVASHDLREPLRKLNVFTQILSRDESNNLTDAGRNLVSKIKSFVVNANELVTDMVTYSNVTAGTRKIQEADVNHIYKACKAALREIILEKGAILESDLSSKITGDPLQIRYLIQSLLMNSLIFHQPGKPPHIQIIGRVISGNEIIHPMVEKNRRYYELIVHDHGIGFEQKFENQIFQLFKKLHNRTEYPGSGIGLTLCKKIVENHKGFIIARGKPNEGSSFYCYFPVIENL